MSLSVDELLRPRYKVIADYFYNPYKIGDIITVLYDDRSVHLTTTSYRDEFGETVEQNNFFNPKRLEDFPHLFKPLSWWEDRHYKDVEAVKHIKNTKTNKVYEVEHYGAMFGYMSGVRDNFTPKRTENWPDGSIELAAYHVPITEAEYNAYINKK